MDSSIIFTVPDPNYKVIVLTKARYDHIIEGHPILRGKSGLIKRVVEHPLIITQDDTFRYKHNYWGYNVSGGLFRDKYLRVAVDVSTSIGDIRTCFIMDSTNLPKNEKTLWQNPEELKKKLGRRIS